ncbi:MAG: HEAT repeat domain-containing protein [bacterium]
MKRYIPIGVIAIVIIAGIYYLFIKGHMYQSTAYAKQIKAHIAMYLKDYERGKSSISVMDNAILKIENYVDTLPTPQAKSLAWQSVAEITHIPYTTIEQKRAEISRRLANPAPVLSTPPKQLDSYGHEATARYITLMNEPRISQSDEAKQIISKMDASSDQSYLEQQLNSRDPLIRIYAASALLKQGNNAGVNILRKALNNDANWYVRLYAASSLAGINDKEAIGVVEGYLKGGDMNYNKVMTAEIYAGKSGNSVFIPVLVNHTSDKNPYVALGANIGLAYLGNSNAIGYLQSALTDPDDAVSSLSAKTLAELGNSAPLSYFRKELVSDDQMMRLEGAKYLALMGDYSGMDILEQAMNSSDYSASIYATGALIEISARKRASH